MSIAISNTPCCPRCLGDLEFICFEGEYQIPFMHCRHSNLAWNLMKLKNDPAAFAVLEEIMTLAINLK